MNIFEKPMLYLAGFVSEFRTVEPVGREVFDFTEFEICSCSWMSWANNVGIHNAKTASAISNDMSLK